nr:hypothetical protein [Tanacetum cinerariifolium]
MTIVGEVNERVTDLAVTQRQDAQELYVYCEDAQDDRALLRAQHEYDMFRELVRTAEAGPQDGPADKMPPKKRTTITTNTAPMTDAAIKALIAQGVADALAEIKPNKTSRNGDDNHDSGTGSRRTKGEIKKLEIELWNLKVKESDEVEKYVGGLPDMIQGSVMASKPKTMHDAIEFATELMDQKIRSLIDRQAENKRKLDDTSRNNQNQQ